MAGLSNIFGGHLIILSIPPKFHTCQFPIDTLRQIEYTAIGFKARRH